MKTKTFFSRMVWDTSQLIRKSLISLKALLLLLVMGASVNVWGGEKTIVLDKLGSTLSTTSNTSVATVDITASSTTDVYTLNYLQGKKQGDAILLAKSTGAFISNKTPIPGAIKSATVYINSGASGKTTYHCAFNTTECKEAYVTGSTAVNITGGNSNKYSCSVDNAKYFCISLGNANNGQVLKVEVTYEDAATPTEPSLSVSPATIDFGEVYQNAEVDAKEVEVTFANLTTNDVAAAISGSVFGIDKTGSFTSGDKITITPSTANLGEYTETLTLSATGVDNQTVTVKMNVVEAPVIEDATVGTILWAESFAHFETKTPSAAGTGTGTTIYGGATISYSQDDTGTKGYTGDMYAGGAAPELLLKQSNKTWTISGIPSGNAAEMSLTFKSNKTTFGVTTTSDKLTITGSGTSWTIAVKSGETAPATFNLTLKNTGSANARIDDVELKVTAMPAAADQVATPVIFTESATPFFEPINVSITCATEGATIQYSVDNGATWNNYSTPFQISATTTIKAKATKTGLTDSYEAEETFTFSPVYASLAALVEAGAPKSGDGEIVRVTLTNEEIVGFYTIQSSGNKNGVKLMSGEQAVEIYQNAVNGTDWVIGGTLSGTLTCPWKLYNSTWELCPANLEDLTYTAPAAKEIASLVIEGTPKTAYEAGESFDVTDLSVKVVYTDETNRTLSTTEYELSVEPDGALSTENTKVTVTATLIEDDTKSTSKDFDITVAAVEGDKLTLASTGVSGNSYTEWTGKTGSEGVAVYAGKSAGSYSSIQLNATNPNGLVSTTSGGLIRKVKVDWNSNTSSTGNRSIDIYGSNTAYTGSGDIYDNEKQGTKLGSIVCGTSTELEISSDYEYVGVRAVGGALYMNAITFIWAAPKQLTGIAIKTVPAVVEYAAGEFFNPAGLVITATYDDASTADIAYEGNEDKFSFSPALGAALATTDEKVTITYGGKSCDQTITVKNIELTSIVVSGNLTKTEYTEGDDFDFTGLVATGYYSDETNKVITDQVDWSIDPATLTAGQTSVSVIATSGLISGNKSYDITVAAAPLEVTWDATAQGYENQQDVTEADFNAIINAEFEGGKYYTTGTAVRVYSGKTFAIHATSGYKITSIVIGFGTGDGSNTITADCGTYSNGTWTGLAKDVTFTLGGTSGHRRLMTFTVTYAAAAPAAATPTITPSAEAETYWEPITVTLATTTDGAAIYYTTNGDAPTTASALYENPIAVSATTTIKAIAVKEGLDNSEVASETFNFGKVFANIAACFADGTLQNNDVVKITNVSAEITSFAQSGKTVYFEGGSFYVNVNYPATYAIGGTLSGSDLLFTYMDYSPKQLRPESWEALTYTASENPKEQGTITATYKTKLDADEANDVYEVTYNGDGKLSVESSDPTVATASLEGTTVTIDPLKAGTTTITISAPATDNFTEVSKSYTLTVNSALTAASLPFAFDGGKNDINPANGIKESGLNSTDYSTSPKLKLDGNGDYVLVKIASKAVQVSYKIKGAPGTGDWSGQFDVLESADGTAYTTVASHTALEKTAETKTHDLLEGTRYIKFVLTTKDNGNVGLGDIHISAPAAPVEIDEDVNASTLTETEEVVIKEGGNLLVTEGEIELGNIVVEVGGKVTIQGTATLTVNNFVIKSTMAGGKSGQVLGVTSTNFTIESNAYYDVVLGDNANPNKWHAFAVPFNVDAINGIYDLDDNKLTNEVNYAIMDYHGDVRAKGQYGWKKFRGIMTPGVFYLMTVDGERTTYRMKMKDGFQVSSSTISVTSYTGAGADTDAGWNGIANNQLGYSSVGVNVQVLDPNSYTFVTKLASTTNFTVGTPFFYQAQEDGSVVMAAADGSKPAYAPAREGAAEIKNVDVTLANDRYTDHLYLSATDEATAEYQIGRDLVKMTMTATPSVPQIFALAYNTALCMVDAPMTNDEAQVSVRLYAPASGEYTLSVSNAAAAEVYLLRNDMPVWNLSESAYTLDLEKGNTEGYSLRIRRAHKQTTDMDAVNGSDESGVQKVIMDNQLYIIYDNQTFNAVGKMVK